MTYERTGHHSQDIHHRQDDWDEVHNQLLAIQKKSLEVSNPNDADEKEADAVAKKVMDGESSQIHGTGGTINRKGEGSAETTPAFQAKLKSSKGGGQPLNASMKSEMESKMGTDFSGVKIHTGTEANSMNESVNAKAFTHGKDIYFNSGHSPADKELLAHELVHTVQQGNGMVQPKIQRQNEVPNMLSNPSYDTIQPFDTITPGLFSSYWFGVVSSYFTVVSETKETLERLKKNKEEEDKLFYIIWQKRPPDPQEQLMGNYSFVHDQYEKEKRVYSSAIFNVSAGGGNEEVYYTFQYKSADRANTDLLSELFIRFVHSKKAGVADEIIGEFAPVEKIETKDGTIDHDKKRRLHGGIQGTGGTPYEDSFPKFGTKTGEDTWQSLFFASDRGKIAISRILPFLYNGYLTYKNMPVDDKQNRVKDNVPMPTYHVSTVMSVEWDAKERKRQEKRRLKNKSYNPMGGVDKFLVAADFIETGEIDPEVNKKIIDPYSVVIKFLNKDSVDEIKEYAPTDKDYIDARIAYDRQHYYTPNIIGLDEIDDPSERLAAKYVAYTLVNYERSIPMTTVFEGWQYNDFRNMISSMRGRFKSSKPVIRDEEFDLILPINKSGEPGKTEYYYYSFAVENRDPNPSGTPLLEGETQEMADKRRSGEVDVFVKRIGKKGELDALAHTETEVNISMADGFPANDAKPEDRKKYVKSRYPALINKYKAVIDYSAADKFRETLSKAVHDHISLEWFSENYKITVHDSLSTIKDILITNDGYNDQGKLAHYMVIDDRIVETSEEVNVLPAADEKTGDVVDPQKYNFEFVTGVNGSRDFYEKRMTPPKVGEEDKFRLPVKQVYDETIGITSWKKSELIALETALEAIPMKFILMLNGFNFFRQKRALKQGGGFSAGGFTSKSSIALYDNAFPAEGDNFFIGSKNAVYTTLMIPIVHEIGHVVASNRLIYTIDGKKWNGMISQLFYSYTQTLATDSTPTNYSEKNYEENFAESFMLYNLDPEFLITNYPEIYWWFDFLANKTAPPEPDAVKKIIDDKKAKNKLYER